MLFKNNHRYHWTAHGTDSGQMGSGVVTFYYFRIQIWKSMCLSENYQHVLSDVCYQSERLKSVCFNTLKSIYNQVVF
ncbi:hypothetical protein HanIR_Chr06g0288591 [Helianthus annuus]|nr:hypothetical protein HanIR_Chr06g0288591 [Helianthus annuus]